jgi:hypothetical protein
MIIHQCLTSCLLTQQEKIENDSSAKINWLENSLRSRRARDSRKKFERIWSLEACGSHRLKLLLLQEVGEFELWRVYRQAVNAGKHRTDGCGAVVAVVDFFAVKNVFLTLIS